MINTLFIKTLVLLSVLTVTFSCASDTDSANQQNSTSGQTPPTTTNSGFDIDQYPLITLDDFQYEGAFRVVDYTYSTGTSLSYSNGTFTIDPAKNSIFVVGNEQHDALAEFKIPEIINTTNLSEVLTTKTILQKYSQFLNRATTGNPQTMDVINGLFLIDGKLIVNTQQYYDGLARNTHTTLVIDDASDIENSNINGYFKLKGTVHSAGWVSEIPPEFTAVLKGDFIAGHASNYAINSRNSMGPTAFVLKKSKILEALNTMDLDTVIEATALMDFDLNNFMYKSDAYTGQNWEVYGYNIFGHKETGTVFNDPDPQLDTDGNIKVNTNDLWTEVSEAHYGFIVPGTRTYVVIGSSGGHNSGLGYKITQDKGYVCGGPCSYEKSDNYNYYWLFDIKDFIDVLDGNKLPHDPRPYEYGKFPAPFQSGFKKIGGGYYDKETNELYISLQRAGQLDQYDKVPLYLKYSININ